MTAPTVRDHGVAAQVRILGLAAMTFDTDVDTEMLCHDVARILDADYPTTLGLFRTYVDALIALEDFGDDSVGWRDSHEGRPLSDHDVTARNLDSDCRSALGALLKLQRKVA